MIHRHELAQLGGDRVGLVLGHEDPGVGHAHQLGRRQRLRQPLAQRARERGVLRRPQDQGGLAELLEVEPITLCRMVDRLQEAGLVERRPDPSDRRAWRLFLSEKANALLAELRPLALGLFDESMNGLTPAERDQLLEMLGRIRANLSRRTSPELAANG